ncbi:MAG TPA: DUF6624 domain-containing protein [Candidatus Polarisedimenticolaceae bacterium]|nr:DUF6624 domain-containing protein [Candidatus Polarisedimenticolaceae bacterium]
MSATPELERIAAELVAMADEDSRVRAELARDGSLFRGYHPQMQAVHDANAARLSAILDVHGWPGRSRVGEHGAHAAWRIVQHAIAQPALQRRVLALLRAAPPGEVVPLEIAMLEDRIRGFEGRGQLYGTQFDWDEAGQLSPLPLEDPEGVDERRAAIGLGPLAADLDRRRAELAHGREKPPRDWAKRQREMEAWLVRVGWRPR